MDRTEIRVHVVDFGRKSLYMRYVDPVTGKQVTRSTGMKIRKEAAKIAAKWEQDLQTGRYKSPSKLSWSEFRDRYEDHLARETSDSTLQRFGNVASVFERIINPKLLVAVTKPQMERFRDALAAEQKSAATIESYVRQLMVGFRWAQAEGLMVEAPALRQRKRKKNGKRIKKSDAGGRALVTEEFERMLDAVPKVVCSALLKQRTQLILRINRQAAAGRPTTELQARLMRCDHQVREVSTSWQHLLYGLWWSGLRISEAVLLTWDDDRKPSMDFSGELPMLWIPAEHQKNGTDQLCPMAPEFAKFLESTQDRTGYVFNPLSPKVEHRPALSTIKRRISDIGERARVKSKERDNGKTKFASSHDLRRAFGFRWSSRVMPPVLKELMRHESIDTTMRYYVTQNAQATARAVWSATPASEVTPEVTPACSDELNATPESPQPIAVKVPEGGLEPPLPVKGTGF